MSKSPFKTAMAVANSMVGTSLLVLPVNYLQKGIVQNTIGAIIMCIIMTATAYAIGTLVSGRQKQFFKIVKRELGERYSNIMAILTAILTLLVSCIIFLLAADILYEMFQQFSDTVSSIGPKIFKSILIIIFLPMCLLNSLQNIVKFSFVSMALIWIYILTIFYSFIENVSNIDSGVINLNIQYSLSNFQFWLAVQGFSFLCHPTIDAVLKQNDKPRKNGKAVIGGYAISFIVMVACGILGAFALYKKEKKNQDANVIDYFIGYWQYYILGISIFIYLYLLFPILAFVSRIQVIEILPQKIKVQSKINLKMKAAFILIFTILIQLFIIFNTGPSAVMGFVGTAGCFYICYFLPMIIKIKLINKVNFIQDNRLDKNSLISSNQYLNNTNEQSQRQSQQLIPYEQRKIRNIYKILYIFIMIFGAILMLGEVWTLFYNLFK